MNKKTQANSLQQGTEHEQLPGVTTMKHKALKADKKQGEEMTKLHCNHKLQKIAAQNRLRGNKQRNSFHALSVHTLWFGIEALNQQNREQGTKSAMQWHHNQQKRIQKREHLYGREVCKHWNSNNEIIH